MNKAIVIKAAPGHRQIEITITQDGLNIELLGGTTSDSTATVPWDQVDNIDFLIEAFASERVDTFMTLVKTMSKVHKEKDTYLKLLDQ